MHQYKIHRRRRREGSKVHLVFNYQAHV